MTMAKQIEEQRAAQRQQTYREYKQLLGRPERGRSDAARAARLANELDLAPDEVKRDENTIKREAELARQDEGVDFDGLAQRAAELRQRQSETYAAIKTSTQRAQAEYEAARREASAAEAAHRQAVGNRADLNQLRSRNWQLFGLEPPEPKPERPDFIFPVYTQSVEVEPSESQETYEAQKARTQNEGLADFARRTNATRTVEVATDG